jgi:hypothetical protein
VPGNASASLSYLGGVTTAATAPTATFGPWTLNGQCITAAEGLEAQLYITEQPGVKGNSIARADVEYTEGEGLPNPQLTPFEKSQIVGTTPALLVDSAATPLILRETVFVTISTKAGKVGTFEGTITSDNSLSTPRCGFVGKGTVTS